MKQQCHTLPRPLSLLRLPLRTSRAAGVTVRGMDATPPDPDTPEGNAERSDALATPDATPVRPSAASRGPGPRERLAAWVGGALRSTEEALNEAVAPNHRVSCRPIVTVQLRAQYVPCGRPRRRSSP